MFFFKFSVYKRIFIFWDFIWLTHLSSFLSFLSICYFLYCSYLLNLFIFSILSRNFSYLRDYSICFCFYWFYFKSLKFSAFLRFLFYIF